MLPASRITADAAAYRVSGYLVTTFNDRGQQVGSPNTGVSSPVPITGLTDGLRSAMFATGSARGDQLRAALLSGLDAIDATLALRATIEAFRAADRRKRPWVYGV